MQAADQAMVAILMTDMVGSTRQWESHREAMWLATQKHDELATQILRKYHGNILKPRGEGDSLLVLFSSPMEAILATLEFFSALSIEEWPEPINIELRAAIHTGDLKYGESDVYGPAVNRCARIRSVGHPRQILVSESAALMSRDRLADGISLFDLGEHRLKDLRLPERIYQVSHKDLPEKYPGLNSLTAKPNNIPTQVSRFIGRREEIEQIAKLVSEHRLVTLTGLAGSGKSRLAAQYAADAIESYEGGVWYVDASASEEMPMLAAIASSIGAETTTNGSAQAIANRLSAASTLILLDQLDSNQSAYSALEQLLSSTPNLKVVATSQESIGVSGECRYRVPLLSLPRESQSFDHSDAVALFLDRARLVRPSLIVGPSERDAIERIVQRLDGMPLAIELAAARLSVLSIELLAQKLEENFRLISGPAHGLTTILSESIRSCGESAQLLPYVSIFEGGCSYEQFCRLCASDNVDEYDALDHLQRLVNRSLIDFRDWLVEPRYSVLGAVREFVKSQTEAAKWERLRTLHAELFFDVLKSGAIDSNSELAAKHFDETQYDQANIRAAHRYWIEQNDTARSLQMCSWLFRYWENRNQSVEGRWFCTRSLDLTVLPHQDALVASVFNASGSLALRQGDFAEAKRLHHKALDIRRALSDARGVAGSLNNLANIASDEGNLTEASQLYEEALAINRESGNTAWQAINLVNLGTLAHRAGDDEKSIEYHLASMAAFEKADMYGHRRFPLVGHAAALVSSGKNQEGLNGFLEALSIALDTGDRPCAIVCLEGIASVCSLENEFARSTQLFECALKFRFEDAFPLSPSDVAEHERWHSANRGGLDASTYARLKAEAESWCFEDAISAARMTSGGGQLLS